VFFIVNLRPEYQMVVTLVYGGNTVVDKTVETSDGCQLYYGSFGPAPLIEIPPWLHGTVCIIFTIIYEFIYV